MNLRFKVGAGGNQPDPLFGLPDPVDGSFGFRALRLIFAFFEKFLKPGVPPARTYRVFQKKTRGLFFGNFRREVSSVHLVVWADAGPMLSGTDRGWACLSV